MTQPPSCLDVAILYAKEGLQIVPIHGPKASVETPGKQPKTTSWQKKIPKEDDLRRDIGPRDNFGVVTGGVSQIICVDIDNHHGPEGLQWFQEHEGELGHFIREETPTGGIHLFFKYPEGYSFVPSMVPLHPGVDFLADNGKQVVTWPSEHAQGGQYRIQNGLTLLDVLDEADAPPWWLLEEAFTAYEKAEAARAIPEKDLAGIEEDCPQEILIVREILSTYPPAVQGDAGDKRTFSVAALCRDHGLSAKITYQLMKELFNPRCSPPWSFKDLEKKVKNAYKHAKGSKGSKAASAMFDAVPPEEQGPPPAPDGPEPEPRAYNGMFPFLSAQTFLDRHRGRVLCDQKQAYFYQTGENRWKMVTDDLLEYLILEDIRTVNAELAERIKTSALSNICRAVKILLGGSATLLKPDTWLTGDRAGSYVSCQNGILDIMTGELIPHQPNWFSFTLLPFDFVPGATCPEFHRFLESVWADDCAIKESLQLWMGYILTTRMDQQKFALLCGASRAGKGTLSRVMEHLVGEENTVACSIGTFGDRFGLAGLLGKRHAIFYDAQAAQGNTAVTATERLISIVGNDPQAVERKNVDLYTVRFPIKITLLCNDIPRFINSRDALSNRMIAFPFDRSFAGKEDQELEGRLLAELPGILNWALEGAIRILKGEKLIQSAAGVRKVEEFEIQADSIRGFIQDCIEYRNDTSAAQSFVTGERLYEAYSGWCKKTNHHAKGRNKFYDDFTNRTAGKVSRGRGEGTRTRGFHGILVNEDGYHGFDEEPHNASENF